MIENDEKEFGNRRVVKINPSDMFLEEKDKDDEEFKSFLLVLALIFNDLKGFVYFEDWRKEYRQPEKDEVSFHAGESFGIAVQLLKLQIGAIHEVVRFLEENKELIRSTKFKNLEEKISLDGKKIWNTLKIVSGTSEEEEINERLKEFLDVLLRVRSNASFHYYQSGKSLARGFRSHFYKEHPGEDEKYKYAFYSSKITNLFETRYFYADASVEHYLVNEFEIIGDVGHGLRDVSRFSAMLKKGISEILDQYHKTIPRC